MRIPPPLHGGIAIYSLSSLVSGDNPLGWPDGPTAWLHHTSCTETRPMLRSCHTEWHEEQPYLRFWWRRGCPRRNDNSDLDRRSGAFHASSSLLECCYQLSAFHCRQSHCLVCDDWTHGCSSCQIRVRPSVMKHIDAILADLLRPQRLVPIWRLLSCERWLDLDVLGLAFRVYWYRIVAATGHLGLLYQSIHRSSDCWQARTCLV